MLETGVEIVPSPSLAQSLAHYKIQTPSGLKLDPEGVWFFDGHRRKEGTGPRSVEGVSQW